MAIASQHRCNAFGCGDKGPTGEIWETSTDLSGHRFSVVMTAQLQADYSFDLNAEIGLAGAYVAYEANATASLLLGNILPLKKCDRWDFQIWALAPTLPNGITLLGEPDKWVPVSQARFQNLAYTDGDTKSASVTIKGAAGEMVNIAWSVANTRLLLKCTIPGGVDGTLLVTVPEPPKACSMKH